MDTYYYYSDFAAHETYYTNILSEVVPTRRSLIDDNIFIATVLFHVFVYYVPIRFCYSAKYPYTFVKIDFTIRHISGTQR